MPVSKKVIDLYWDALGDFSLGDDGDLRDTKNYRQKGLIQKIDTYMQSSQGDWLAHPDMAADITNVVGKQNTRENGRILKNQITYALSRIDDLVSSRVTVDVFPVSERQVAIIIIVVRPGTSEGFTRNYTYDLRDNKMIPRNL